MISAHIKANPIENNVVRFLKLGKQQQDVSLPVDSTGGDDGLIEILKMITMNATVLMRSNDTPEFNQNKFIISSYIRVDFILRYNAMFCTLGSLTCCHHPQIQGWLNLTHFQSM